MARENDTTNNYFLLKCLAAAAAAALFIGAVITATVLPQVGLIPLIPLTLFCSAIIIGICLLATQRCTPLVSARGNFFSSPSYGWGGSPFTSRYYPPSRPIVIPSYGGTHYHNSHTTFHRSHGTTHHHGSHSAGNHHGHR